MSKKLDTIGAAVASMFAEKSEADAAAKARAERLPGIIEARAIFTPEILERIAADEMPENFEITREAYVAMAQLASRAVQLVGHAVAAIEPVPAAPKH